jgi:hypothetical protein
LVNRLSPPTDSRAIHSNPIPALTRPITPVYVIAVFPLKTGDSMFVGFDSQNTSHSLSHYPNWNLRVWGISLFGVRGWSENLSWKQLDVVVLASGDGDFDLLLSKIRNDFGVSAEVYGVAQLTARSLINSASKFTPIEDDLLLK